ncbi:MAG: hypothetical protein R3B09_00855 [Nannocystaceae bacterium]
MRTSLTSLLLASLTLAACTGSDPIEATASGTSDGSTTDGSSTSTTGTTASSTGTATDTVSTGSESDTATTSTTTTTSSETSSTTEPITTTDTTSTTDSTTTSTTTDVTTGTTDSTTGTTDSTTDSTTDVTTDVTTGTTGVMEDPCPCADVEVPLDDGIFVLSDNAQLWKYKPMDNTFEMLGSLGCGMTNTFSMAVDRLGFAWVMFNSPAGVLRKVDVTNPNNCTDPGYLPGQMGVTYYGMAYVTKDQFNTCDQLYGNTWNGQGGFSEGPNFGNFLTVDPMNLQLQLLGATTFNGAEVTGTGDGRAFLFGGANPAKLVEVNKQNGQFLDVLPLGNLSLTNAFAFAFFAGDFYMFTESAGPGSKSKVTQLDYDDSDNNGIQDLTVVNMNAPIRIVGAGVSTCAPFNPQ